MDVKCEAEEGPIRVSSASHCWFGLATNELDSVILYCQGFIFIGEAKSIIFWVPLPVAVILDASAQKVAESERTTQRLPFIPHLHMHSYDLTQPRQLAQLQLLRRTVANKVCIELYHAAK